MWTCGEIQRKTHETLNKPSWIRSPSILHSLTSSYLFYRKNTSHTSHSQLHNSRAPFQSRRLDVSGRHFPHFTLTSKTWKVPKPTSWGLIQNRWKQLVLIALIESPSNYIFAGKYFTSLTTAKHFFPPLCSTSCDHISPPPPQSIQYWQYWHRG